MRQTPRVKSKHSGPRRLLKRFANPWSFRGSPRAPEQIADFSGRPADVSEYRRGGVWIRVPAPHDPLRSTSALPAERSMLVELRRRVSATVARYRNQTSCTLTELRTIEALWLDGMTLRELARREGVMPQAISARINGLANKAPEFCRYWRQKNRSHQRRFEHLGGQGPPNQSFQSRFGFPLPEQPPHHALQDSDNQSQNQNARHHLPHRLEQNRDETNDECRRNDDDDEERRKRAKIER